MGGFDAEHAAIGHGVSRVDGEVQDRRLKLITVSKDPGQPRRDADFKRDVLGQDAAQHGIEVVKEHFKVVLGGLQRGAAPKGQQLGRECGTTLGRGDDLINQRVLFLITGVAQKFRCGQGDGHHIVKVMRHT